MSDTKRRRSRYFSQDRRSSTITRCLRKLIESHEETEDEDDNKREEPIKPEHGEPGCLRKLIQQCGENGDEDDNEFDSSTSLDDDEEHEHASEDEDGNEPEDNGNADEDEDDNEVHEIIRESIVIDGDSKEDQDDGGEEDEDNDNGPDAIFLDDDGPETIAIDDDSDPEGGNARGYNTDTSLEISHGLAVDDELGAESNDEHSKKLLQQARKHTTQLYCRCWARDGTGRSTKTQIVIHGRKIDIRPADSIQSDIHMLQAISCNLETRH
ncbi:hypothetical protein M409DRAFT_60289 [Zasmidium cellare ATCC 36951]|uniref:Uncharacterized protein n=1 Tax=Zasmidium cellare ATCC 36951 TaxID=1080233 RepID=A0A6A6C3Q4_ZASCE|nr:uncharacterized protein M409DRAFT_60289 [Zasmidium cellare ATCC 36951]KAF2160026.1 hypothetical protein M409DRAFT_60289 [Zasmidium cellare ATCC 36951]